MLTYTMKDAKNFSKEDGTLLIILIIQKQVEVVLFFNFSTKEWHGGGLEHSGQNYMAWGLSGA